MASYHKNSPTYKKYSGLLKKKIPTSSEEWCGWHPFFFGGPTQQKPPICFGAHLSCSRRSSEESDSKCLGGVVFLLGKSPCGDFLYVCMFKKEQWRDLKNWQIDFLRLNVQTSFCSKWGGWEVNRMLMMMMMMIPGWCSSSPFRFC